MIDPGLQNRVVAVTGGNNPAGIGASTAKAFAAQGARVFLHYFRESADDVVRHRGGPLRTGGARMWPGLVNNAAHSAHDGGFAQV